MGRSSTRENKTRYQLTREELGLSREKASELLETIAPERIEKIESERSLPRPDEVRFATIFARGSAPSASSTCPRSAAVSFRTSC